MGKKACKAFGLRDRDGPNNRKSTTLKICNERIRSTNIQKWQRREQLNARSGFARGRTLMKRKDSLTLIEGIDGY